MANTCTEQSELMLMQTSNTTRLAVYYLLHCVESIINKYLLEIASPNQVNLCEVITFNTESQISCCIVLGAKRMTIKKIKMNEPKAKIFELIAANKKDILQALNNHYLKENNCSKWNAIIGDIYGANFSMIDYTINSKNKLKQLSGGYEFDESQFEENYVQVMDAMNAVHQTHLLFPTIYNVPFDNKKLLLVENYLLSGHYDEALKMLDINENDKTKYNIYYRNIYKVSVIQKSMIINQILKK